MGPHYDGTHLLDEVLGRLDLFNRAPLGGGSLKNSLKRAAASLPGRVQRHVTAFAAPTIRRRIMGHALHPCQNLPGLKITLGRVILWSPTILYMEAFD